MLLDPRVVGRALEREVERDLQPVLGGRRHENSKSSIVPRSGWTVSCPPLGAPIAHGEPGSSGAGSRACCSGPCGTVPDRMDRRQVDDVEAHGARPPAAAWPRCGTFRAAAASRRRALRAREELVPGAVEGAGALDAHRPRAGECGCSRSGMGGQSVLHGRSLRRVEPLLGGLVLVAHRRGALTQHLGRVLVGGVGGGPVEDPGALLELQLDVDAGGQLDLGLVLPRLVRVTPRDHVVAPVALAVELDLRAPAVGLERPHLAHAHERTVGLARAEVGVRLRAWGHELDLHAEGVVTLAEGGDRDCEGLTHDGLHGVPTALDHRVDVDDGVATNHASRRYYPVGHRRLPDAADRRGPGRR